MSSVMNPYLPYMKPSTVLNIDNKKMVMKYFMVRVFSFIL